MSLAAASGPYVAQWDDDDWYSPHRLQMQLGALDIKNADACFLSRWSVAWPERGIYGVSHERIGEGSMLAKKSVLPPYPSLRRGEDTVAVKAMVAAQTKLVFLNCP